VGDFNGDGRLDVVVTGSDNNGNGRVSILLGNGDGTFQAAQNFPVGWYPSSVAVGDFNGDGRLDLAVSITGTYPNFKESSVSVLLGNGDGTLQAAQNFAVGIIPGSVVVGDFNGDGRLDVVVTGSDDNGNGRVSILLGNGDGTFQAAQNFPVGNRPNSVVVGDFNGDGRLDLAVAASQDSYLQGTVSILLGNGDGTFQAAQNFPVGRYPSSVVVGDVNGDGVPDLVVTSGTELDEITTSGTVHVLLGKGDGTFRAFPASHVSYVAGDFVNSVAVGDFNGDGWLDAVTANSTLLDAVWANASGDVSILLNDSVWGGGR
jgi:hypothetical protein